MPRVRSRFNSLEGESAVSAARVLKRQVTCVRILSILPHKISQNAEGEKPIIQAYNGLSQNRPQTLKQLCNKSCNVYSLWHYSQ